MLFRIMKRSRFNFILWYFILSVPFLQMFFYFDLFSILSYGISILSYGISSFNFIIQFHHSILSYGISSFLSLFCKCFSISIYFMNIYSLLFFFLFHFTCRSAGHSGTDIWPTRCGAWNENPFFFFNACV